MFKAHTYKINFLSKGFKKKKVNTKDCLNNNSQYK